MDHYIPPDVLARANFTFFCKNCREEHKYSYKDLLESIAEQTFWIAKFRPNKGLDMVYKSYSEEVTSRIIIPKKASGLWAQGKREIREFEAYCTERKSRRNFKPERIQVAYDVVSGEKVNPTQWLLEHLIE